MLETKIKELGRRLGLEIGITSADPFPQVGEALAEREHLWGLPQFMKRSLQLYAQPGLSLPGARSIIAAAIPYRSQDPPEVLGTPRGRLSRYTWGMDYHQILTRRLQILAEHLPDPSLICVDTGPLIDRAVAHRAGLGWIGENTTLIHPKFGSWVFLGGIITQTPLEPDQPLDGGCDGCGACRKACPVGALPKPYRLNPQQCLSAATQQTMAIPHHLRKHLGQRLYGCDACQEACPKNKEAALGEDWAYPLVDMAPQLSEILSLDQERFAHTFHKTALAYSGLRPLQRNALLILGGLSNTSLLPQVLQFLTDPRPQIRASAAWAALKMGDLSPVLRALKRETDATAREDIARSLEIGEGS